MKNINIIAAKRTPIGGFLGQLSHLSATELGKTTIQSLIKDLPFDLSKIDSVYMGNVLSANLGQSPARQAAIKAGIPNTADATTINKVCASGMKAVMMAAQQIQIGINQIVIAGGMESMSNVPHYVMHRKVNKLGHHTLIDGLLKDGLTDAYHGFHMGNAAEICTKEYNITREAQDMYALLSYKRAVEATVAKKFKKEIVPIEITTKNGISLLDYDEDIYKLITEKIGKLPASFEADGTITAANASNLNDGASALLLVSDEIVAQYQLKPLARIIGYADAAQSPEKFTTSPSLAIPKALERAQLRIDDIDYFEINEAYAAVILANQQILGLDTNKVNVYGGGVALGHPIGSSGSRIIVTLLSVLAQEGGKYGLASICNGGGGASAVVVEMIV